MKRRFFGAVAATAAAPFSLMFFFTLLDLVVQGEGQLLWGRGGFPNILPYGIIALVLFSIPLLFIGCLSALIASSLEKWGLLSRWPYMLGGASMGLGFMALLGWEQLNALPQKPLEEQLFFTMGAPSGALCGWIYWQIALRQRPDPAGVMRQEPGIRKP